MRTLKRWKIKFDNWETVKTIFGTLRLLAVKMKLMKPLPPIVPLVDMKKRILELTKKLQEQYKVAGIMFCVECSRTSGMKYKYADGSRGIVLRKITKGIYVCTDCLARKYGVTHFPKKGAHNDRTKEEGRSREGSAGIGDASRIPASGGQGEDASTSQRAGGNDGEGGEEGAGEGREEGAGKA